MSFGGSYIYIYQKDPRLTYESNENLSHTKPVKIGINLSDVRNTADRTLHYDIYFHYTK